MRPFHVTASRNGRSIVVFLSPDDKSCHFLCYSQYVQCALFAVLCGADGVSFNVRLCMVQTVGLVTLCVDFNVRYMRFYVVQAGRVTFHVDFNCGTSGSTWRLRQKAIRELSVKFSKYELGKIVHV